MTLLAAAAGIAVLRPSCTVRGSTICSLFRTIPSSVLAVSSFALYRPNGRERSAAAGLLVRCLSEVTDQNTISLQRLLRRGTVAIHNAKLGIRSKAERIQNNVDSFQQSTVLFPYI